MARDRPSRRETWRRLAASPLPFLVPLWALWREVYVLDADGIERLGGGKALAEWALLSLATAGLVASFWAGDRSLRVLGYTLYALLLSVAFGVAAVLGVMHGLGGPDGRLAAPAWALVALGGVAALCVAALLAAAALLVTDVKEGGA
ncbi:MAG TPA: hypothetical protein VL691_03965 [Vicinamibacteria bacterium]|nr:hypothetical protein [Vicinamibacteria bacterium]